MQVLGENITVYTNIHRVYIDVVFSRSWFKVAGMLDLQINTCRKGRIYTDIQWVYEAVKFKRLRNVHICNFHISQNPCVILKIRLHIRDQGQN